MMVINDVSMMAVIVWEMYSNVHTGKQIIYI